MIEITLTPEQMELAESDCVEAMADRDAENEALKAERDRYREALERVANGTWNNRPGPAVAFDDFAREALE